LAEGTYCAALKIGKKKKTDVLQYAVQSNGIRIGAHSIRNGKDYPGKILYACSVQGGDHASTTGLPIDGSESEVWKIFNDSSVYCDFDSFGVTRRVRLDFYEAATGLEFTPEKWSRTGALRILQCREQCCCWGT